MILALGAGTAPAHIVANVAHGGVRNESRLLSVLNYSGLIPTCGLQHQTCSLRGTNSSDASPKRPRESSLLAHRQCESMSIHL